MHTPAYQTTPSPVPVPQEEQGSAEEEVKEDGGFLSSLGSMLGVTTEAGSTQEEQGLYRGWNGH